MERDDQDGMDADLDAADFDDAPPPAGLGAIGQLAVAILTVAALVLVFMGGSLVFGRLFG